MKPSRYASAGVDIDAKAAALSGAKAYREALRTEVDVLLVLLIGLAFAARLVEYGADDRVPIGGTAGLLSARPELAREIEELDAAIRADSEARNGLVVFPEGEILNFLSGRRNPLRDKLYLPGHLNAENEGEILGELQRAAPAAVVIWRRALGEYGAGSFGEDYAPENPAVDWRELRSGIVSRDSARRAFGDPQR